MSRSICHETLLRFSGAKNIDMKNHVVKKKSRQSAMEKPKNMIGNSYCEKLMWNKCCSKSVVKKHSKTNAVKKKCFRKISGT